MLLIYCVLLYFFPEVDLLEDWLGLTILRPDFQK